MLPERAVKDLLKRFPLSEQEATRLKMARVGCHNMIRQLASKRLLKPAEVYHFLSGLSDETLLILMAKSKEKQSSARSQRSSRLSACEANSDGH